MTHTPTRPHEPEGRLRIDSLSLFGNHREIIISHAGARYVLRITHQNKLILTK